MTIEEGQEWVGDVRTGFRHVRVNKVGEQPKRKRITFSDIDHGYTFSLYQSEFERLYTLKEKS